jgi:sensor histidine kinase YesM
MQLIQSRYTRLNQMVNNRLIQHLFYWISYVCFFGFTWGTYDWDFQKTFTVELISLPPKIILVYASIYWLLPRYLFQGKTSQFIIGFLALLFLTSLLHRVLDYYIILDNYFPHWDKWPLLRLVTLLSTAIKMCLVLAIPVTISITQHVNRVQRQKEKLSREKLEAELQLLKSQLHPHFLFNTLNSLYSLILKKSDSALDLTLRLSDLLRYLLYETQQPYVHLSRELAFVQDYLELEKIRFADQLEIEFRQPHFTEELSIAPMLLMPLVENSVKHSTSGPEEVAQIRISAELKDGKFDFSVWNSLPSSAQANNLPYKGIGLRNLRQRLQMQYPGAHELSINVMEKAYEARLVLNLKHVHEY